MAVDLIKHAVVVVMLIAGWFALVLISHNIYVQIVLGWAGFAVLALYFRWLRKNKLRQGAEDDMREQRYLS